MGGAYRAANQYLTLRPEVTYRKTLEKVIAHPAMPQHLGTDIKAGLFRVHSFREGGVKGFEKLSLGKSDFSSPTSAESDLTIAGKRIGYASCTYLDSHLFCFDIVLLPGENASNHGWLQYLRPRRLQLVFEVRHFCVRQDLSRNLG